MAYGGVIADTGAYQKTPGVLLIAICSASEVKGVCVGRMNDMCERFLRINGKMHSSGEIISRAGRQIADDGVGGEMRAVQHLV